MYVVVAYDVSDDRRRTKLHEVLLGYGSPVQRSVFECDLDARQLAKLRRAAAKLVRASDDSIRYYYFCQACSQRTESAGTALVERGEGDFFA